jgi:hypothetical protein
MVSDGSQRRQADSVSMSSSAVSAATQRDHREATPRIDS